MPTATLIRNGQRKEKLVEQDDGGFAGERWFRVDHADPGQALYADGLPVRGAIWSLDYPAVTCREREAELGEATERECWVRCAYRTPSNARDVPPYDGLRYTLIRRLTGSESISFDVAGGKLGPDGAAVSVTAQGLTLVSYHATMPDDGPLRALHDKLNESPIVFPRFMNQTAQVLPADAGVALYQGYDADFEGKLLRLEHQFALSSDWRVLVVPQNGVGDATGEAVPHVIYESAPFTALGL